MKNFCIALIALCLNSLACSIFVGGPAFPPTPIPGSTEAVQSLHDQVNQAMTAGAQSGTVSLQITESQLTSYLSYYLSSQPNPMITNPQVVLQNGKIQLFGQAEGTLLTANVSIRMQVMVDPNGQPKINITQTDFGPLPVPQGLNDTVSGLVQQAFTGSLGPVATGFRLETVTIADGLMTVTGRIK
jgi:uncharacterized protein YpmS